MPKFDEDDPKTVEFTPDAVKRYLDEAIQYWRIQHRQEHREMAQYYIDAFQSVRTSLFGETLPLEDEWEKQQ